VGERLVVKPTWEPYAAGDKIAHGVFGEGTVLSVKPMGGDLLLEIDFGKSTRKIMANYAKLTRL
jgi:DNA helicase-2/ATP-dependent DNA helicase PcrA